MNSSFTLALIAHDREKDALADFVLDHRSTLSQFNLVATGGTGSLIRRRTGLRVSLLQHGPEGGDQQLAEAAEESEVQAVIFFRDPISAGANEPDFADLLAICDRNEIPLATNRGSAEALVYFLANSPDRGAVAARPWGLVGAGY